MGKVLIIAEKPSVGRDIARVLKCNKKGDGFLSNDEYIVSWAIGHLVTLFDPEDYDVALKKWRYETLPIIPQEIKLKPIAKTKKQLNILKSLMKDKEVDSFICATDSGREGELIFRYIYDIVKSKKPFKRLWISSMTDQAIKEGFDNLKEGTQYDNLYLSAKCRSESDWLVGINASRAYTMRYDALLSIGRVQTPTLAIIVERQKEIDEFSPKDYWEITSVFDRYRGKWFDKANNDTKIFDKEKVERIIVATKDSNGVVTSIELEEKKQLPPLLYDLTELQRDCNKKFGFPASKTLSIAQDLYEKRKMITYPRTDSRYLSQDMVSKIKQTLVRLNVEPYNKFAQYVLDLEKLPITKRIIDDTKVTDHHAIIPTDTKINLMGLSADEHKVYDLIAKRFISVFYPNYIYSVTKIITAINNENFITKGNTIIQLGYMEIYKDDIDDKPNKKSKNDDDTLEAILPDVNIGDEIIVNDVVSEQKKTKPPKAYNEAMLLSAMENAGRFIEDENLKEQLKESGLGTPATRAAIIERLLHVGYLQRSGKTLMPTEKAMKLIDIVPPELKSPETTGKWEKGLTSVAKGTMMPDKFMASIKRYVVYIIQQSQNTNISVQFEKDNTQRAKTKTIAIGKCPVCGNGEIFENSKAYFCSGWKTGCKFTIWKDSTQRYGVTLDKKIIKILLKNRKVKDVGLTLPQTMEKCRAELVLKENGNGMVEFINLERIKEDSPKDTIADK